MTFTADYNHGLPHHTWVSLPIPPIPVFVKKMRNIRSTCSEIVSIQTTYPLGLEYLTKIKNQPPQITPLGVSNIPTFSRALGVGDS